MSFVVPSFPGPQTVHVMATAHYLDSEGDLHESRGMTSFEVFGPLRVYKYAEDEMNFGERSFVHLSVRNVGNRSLEVELSDSPGRDFRADSNLEWNMTVPPVVHRPQATPSPRRSQVMVRSSRRPRQPTPSTG